MSRTKPTGRLRQAPHGTEGGEIRLGGEAVLSDTKPAAHCQQHCAALPSETR
ncbi:hypothetical protein [Winogradskya humida]|uniref:hypothetical protein n=1 Tax=Winogradskya humida TaxID=113566 RepID=UPI0019411356|nr:hypothetical protein [Actinoplanes humidus]